jgi:hypothetical protein
MLRQQLPTPPLPNPRSHDVVQRNYSTSNNIAR